MTQPVPANDVKERSRELPLRTFCLTPHAGTADFCATCGGPVGTMATVGPFETIRTEYWLLGRQGPPHWMLRTVFVGMVVGLVVKVTFLGWGFLPDLGREKPLVIALTLLGALGVVGLNALLIRYLYRRWWKRPAAPLGD